MMKKLSILIMTVATISMTAHAGMVTVKLNPVADTYVADGVYGTNYYGTEGILRVQSYSDNDFGVLDSIQHTYLKFHLASEIPPDAVILSAVFGIRLNAIFLGQHGLYEEDPWVDLHYVQDDNWNDGDNQISWLTKPGFDPIAIGDFQNTVDIGVYYKWDLLAGPGFQWPHYADDLAADDGYISLMLKMNPFVEDENNAWAAFYSRENDLNYQPYLKITYIPEPATLALLAMGMGGIGVFRKKH